MKLYAREDISPREWTEIDIENDMEDSFIESNLRNSKWLLFVTFKSLSLSKVIYFLCLHEEV